MAASRAKQEEQQQEEEEEEEVVVVVVAAVERLEERLGVEADAEDRVEV